MQHLLLPRLAAMMLTLAPAPAAAKGDESWVGKRVEGPWLWIVAEEFGARGWVKAADVIPFDRAIEYSTQPIEAKPDLGGVPRG